jgi:AcrR family transcriptional regulator
VEPPGARAVNVKRKSTLRDAQKAHTRQRIIEAARAVFYQQGYYGATVDQIVAEAGASRPTFYLHFRDKEQVLAELMSEYSARAAPYMDRLPGPRPTVEELIHWLFEVGEFFQQERAVFSVLTEIGAHGQPNAAEYGLRAMDLWIGAMSARAPAFAAAANARTPDVNARARAALLVIEMIWAGANVAADKDSAFTRETVNLVATSLHGFLNDRRFHTSAAAERKTLRQVPARRKARLG